MYPVEPDLAGRNSQAACEFWRQTCTHLWCTSVVQQATLMVQLVARRATVRGFSVQTIQYLCCVYSINDSVLFLQWIRQFFPPPQLVGRMSGLNLLLRLNKTQPLNRLCRCNEKMSTLSAVLCNSKTGQVRVNVYDAGYCVVSRRSFYFTSKCWRIWCIEKSFCNLFIFYQSLRIEFAVVLLELNCYFCYLCLLTFLMVIYNTY